MALLLHGAAVNLDADYVLFYLEHHPLFDHLVNARDGNGDLARDVLREPSSLNERADASVIASALSCRRSTRAACVIWCVEHAASSSSPHRSVALPRELGQPIARFVVSKPATVEQARRFLDASDAYEREHGSV
jgi:hypothetical protein